MPKALKKNCHWVHSNLGDCCVVSAPLGGWGELLFADSPPPPPRDGGRNHRPGGGVDMGGGGGAGYQGVHVWSPFDLLAPSPPPALRKRSPPPPLKLGYI